MISLNKVPSIPKKAYRLKIFNILAFQSFRYLFAKLALIIRKRNLKNKCKISNLNEKGFEFFYSSNSGD